MTKPLNNPSEKAVDVQDATPSHETMIEMYRRMLRIRRFEEMVAELSGNGEIGGAVHLTIGQEAAIVGACLALRSDDYMTGTHRSHGHPLAKGARPGPLMAELLGRRTGVCKGNGGSMHLADFSVGSLGETSIVGSGLPIATGGALSAQMRGTDQVAICFFGDGASNQGTFHESLNLAAIWKLPVVYFCENNQYALSTSAAYSISVPDIAQRAAAYGMPGDVVDGQDPIATYQATARAVHRARIGEGPSLIEAKTYRFVEHAQGLRLNYRSSDEVARWRERDPLSMFEARLISMGAVRPDDLQGLGVEVEVEVQEAVEFARNSEFPELSQAALDMYAEPVTL